MANYTVTAPIVPAVPTALGGGEVAARYNADDRGFKRVCESLNALYATNGVPCVNDPFQASEQALTSADPRTRRYRFRAPFVAGGSVLDTFEIVLYAQRFTANLGVTWSFNVSVNGVVSVATMMASDTFAFGSLTIGAFTLGTFQASAATVQTLDVSVNTYGPGLNPSGDLVLALCVIPVRSRATIPTDSYPRDVYALPQDEVDADKGASTWQLQWARRMAEAMWLDRLNNHFTSTQFFNEDTSASGLLPILPGLQSGADFTTQIVGIMRPQLLPGVTQLVAHVYSSGGGTLQLVTDRSNVTVAGPALPGWSILTADVTDLVDPMLYFGVQNATVESLCVFESQASF